MNTPAPGSHRAPAFPVRPTGSNAGSERGATLIEVLLTLAVAAAMTGIALPLTRDSLDEIRTSLAARYVAARLARARMDAVSQSRVVAIRFVAATPDDRFATFADGNGNGARTTEMVSGVDPQVSPYEALADKFSGVRFGLRDGVPDVDGAFSGSSGIRFGTARIASLGPDGTATSGTAYLHGRRSQFAVRVLGATGRVRVFRYDTGTGWVAH